MLRQSKSAASIYQDWRFETKSMGTCPFSLSFIEYDGYEKKCKRNTLCSTLHCTSYIFHDCSDASESSLITSRMGIGERPSQTVATSAYVSSLDGLKAEQQDVAWYSRNHSACLFVRKPFAPNDHYATDGSSDRFISLCVSV